MFHMETIKSSASNLLGNKKEVTSQGVESLISERRRHMVTNFGRMKESLVRRNMTKGSKSIQKLVILEGLSLTKTN
jgi:hypothetical protein